jgi:uncharacterized protein YjbI with pentapeptide repeats
MGGLSGPKGRVAHPDLTQNIGQTHLRGVTWPGAIFEDCRFEHCKLAKLDFGGSILRRSTFTGRLSEVIFRDVPWDHEHFEPNEMDEVDFHDAELYFVEFRNLALRRVRWPENAAKRNLRAPLMRRIEQQCARHG